MSWPGEPIPSDPADVPFNYERSASVALADIAEASTHLNDVFMVFKVLLDRYKKETDDELNKKSLLRVGQHIKVLTDRGIHTSINDLIREAEDKAHLPSFNPQGARTEGAITKEWVDPSEHLNLHSEFLRVISNLDTHPSQKG
ncbi:MAG: hypothetical protein ABIP50_03155 [Candidatus Saccharimonadales bacterium]